MTIRRKVLEMIGMFLVISLGVGLGQCGSVMAASDSNNNVQSVSVIDVTVPLSFPVAVGADETVSTSSQAKICNNGNEMVSVTEVSITCDGGWGLSHFESVGNEAADSKLFGWRMSMGGYTLFTTGSGSSEVLWSGQEDGNIQIPSGGELAITYDVAISKMRQVVAGETIGTVMFTLSSSPVSDTPADDPDGAWARLEEETTLVFYLGNRPSDLTGIYTGFDRAVYTSASQVPWRSVIRQITAVRFEGMISPISTAYWFDGAEKLTDFSFTTLINYIPVTMLDTQNTTSMHRMFAGCASLAELPFNSWSQWLETGNVTDMSQMFFGCTSLGMNGSGLNLGKFDTGNVVNMSGMFQGCENLTWINMDQFNTSSVKDMSSMFQGCKRLTGMNLSSFDTSSAVTMKNMFAYCENSTWISVEKFDTSKVKDLSGMFQGCSKIEWLDLRSFTFSKDTEGSGMFEGCGTSTLGIAVSTEFGKTWCTATDGFPKYAYVQVAS